MLPQHMHGAANPKSSTGRVDVFTRLITDGAQSFDHIPMGYHGPMRAEISPCTFSVLVRRHQAQPGASAARAAASQTRDRFYDGPFAEGTGWVFAPSGTRASSMWIASAATTARFLGTASMRKGRVVLEPAVLYLCVERESWSFLADEAAEMADPAGAW